VNTIMGIEHRRHGGTQSVPKAQPQPQPQPQGPKPQRPLSDLLMRRAV
jgi:hypothetical protein